MSWMHMYSGGKFHVNEPEKTEFKIEDIAHALSNICRFGGHCKTFYSVGEHSLLVAKIVKDNGGSHLEQLWALMHDATEAYMGDIPTPLKATLEGFHEREEALMRIIAKSMGLPPHLEGDALFPKIVRAADRIAVVTEARQLTRGTAEWGPDYHKIKSHPVPLLGQNRPTTVEANFLAKYEQLATLAEDESAITPA